MDNNETDLIDAAVAQLRRRLPDNWAVERSTHETTTESPTRLDGRIDLRDPNGTFTTFAVEAKQDFAPRDVQQILGGLARVLRSLAGHVPLLVVAPWISPRTQELLEAEKMNFLDLTGNAFVKLDNPVVYIRSAGSTRNPAPAARATARLRGSKAARLIRLLADVRPPYGVGDLATATELAPGYISRLLDALYKEALVERGPRGVVLDVNTPELIRSWAEGYDLFRSNRAKMFLAPAGTTRALGELSGTEANATVALTGSFAASRLAPVAAASLLTLYCEDPRWLIDRLALIPADDGGNVALLYPFDRAVWERTTRDDGLQMVAPSQVAVDCLTGTGRMPAEGEAVLDWMMQNEQTWRYESLTALAKDTAAS